MRGRRFARAHEGPPRSRRHRVEDWGADQAFEPQVAARPRGPRARPPSPRGHRPRSSLPAEVVEAPEPEVVQRGPPHDPHQRPPRRAVGDRAVHVHRAPPAAAADRRGAPGGRPDADHRLGVRARALPDPHRNPYLLERLRSQAPRPTLMKGKDAAASAPPSSLSPGRFAMKTQMSRFQIHDDLTAPEASLPVIKGALAGAGQLPNFLGVLAGSPAALRGYTRFRSELAQRRAVAADARADRARGRGPAPVRARACAARAHRAAGRPRPRRARARPRVGLARRPRGGAPALPAAARPSTAAARATCSRRRARPAGATSSCSRRSPSWRSSRSRRWCTWPATCRPTARWRTRASCAPRRP